MGAVKPARRPAPDPAGGLDALREVMRRLRDPAGGCPWDLEQNFTSIAPHTIEEAHEVADAIARGDMKDLREELGDLLFQVIYHAQMAAEQSAFTLDDVISDVTGKMIRRHPHVFGDASAESADDVSKIWEAEKRREKTEDGTATQSPLANIPTGLPPFIRARKLLSKAASEGFTWTSADQILEKLDEEVQELKDAIHNSTTGTKGAPLIEEELGDTLFVLVNLARFLDMNAEEALRKSNAKFIQRFNYLFKKIQSKNQKIKNTKHKDLLKLWQESKKIH